MLTKILIAAGLLWPLTFPYLSKIGAKKAQAESDEQSPSPTEGTRKDDP